MTVVLAEYLFRGDAEIARAALSSAGINSMVRADDEGGLSPGFYSDFRVALLVNEEDVATARDLLDIDPPLQVPSEVRQAMMNHAEWALPNEACGLIAGSRDRVAMVLCLTNRFASPSRYTIDPREHYGAAKFVESLGLEIIGGWHSHPQGDASMSPTDAAQSPGGSWISLIVGRLGKPSEALRAYRTDDGAVIELDVVLAP